MLLTLISIPILLGLLALGIPIYLGLALTGVGGILILTDLQTTLNVLQQLPYPTVASYLLLVIPLFVMMGNLAFSAGVSHSAYDIGRKWLSKLPGGLAMASMVGCAAFAAVCGSSPATAAAMGKVAIPEMLESGYDKKMATGCIATGGCLGIMIPPSIVLVLYGVLTETSVGALLIAGVIPGLVTLMIFILGIFLLCRFNPELAPPTRSYPWKDRFLSLKGGWGVIILFAIVIGGIYLGIATPTEAAALGTVASFIMMLMTKGSVWQRLKAGLVDTARTTGMIFLIVVGAMIYSHFLKIAGVTNALAQGLGTLQFPPFIILLLALAIYIPAGMFLEPMSILLITLPILHPIIVGQLGYNTIWFGILVTKLIEIGLITPPVGLNVFVIAGMVPSVPLEDVFKGVSWFLMMELVTLGVLIAFPILSTWLPSMMH